MWRGVDSCLLAKKKKKKEREREEKGQAVLLVRIGLPLVRRVELQKFYSEIAAILHWDCGSFTLGLWRFYIWIAAILQWDCVNFTLGLWQFYTAAFGANFTLKLQFNDEIVAFCDKLRFHFYLNSPPPIFKR